ncbi:helix-turn-helix domain-containing protein [Lyngbya aestuarii]|uniref:helix-turn-helix domain-containing protein n=1 Tax=Lyngbya aestuarii TaxID=118322 RepID=UPI00403D7986
MTTRTYAFGSPTNLRQRTFSRRDSLPLRPDGLWQIARGAVRTLTWNQEGTLITLGYWGPGDVVGQPLSKIQPYQVECLTSVEVSYIPSHQYYQALDAIMSNIQQSEEMLNIIRHERMPYRLHQLLIWLGNKFGRDVNSGRLIDLRLTHQGLAEAIGTRRVTVTRILNQFEREGIISRPRRNFIVICVPMAKVKEVEPLSLMSMVAAQ